MAAGTDSTIAEGAAAAATLLDRRPRPTELVMLEHGAATRLKVGVKANSTRARFSAQLACRAHSQVIGSISERDDSKEPAQT